MRSKASLIRLRLLLPAALIAGSAVVGGSAFQPVIACAAPNDDAVRDLFEACARGADDAYLDGKLTDAQYDDLLEDCCLDSGGVWTPTIFPRCSARQEVEPVPRDTVPPPSEAATETPPTPRLPVVPQPSDNATVTPQPAAPPTTSSTFPPPPPR